MLEIIVDNFAGGGGTSEGIEQATGRPVDAAINHNPLAIAMHRVNHPQTKHYCEDIWEVDPYKVAAGRPVALAWFSPDCCHFSKAKGGKPVEKSIRGLAWVSIKWASTVRPRVIMLENVEEFQTWGPLIAMRDRDTGRVIKLEEYINEHGEKDVKHIVAKRGEVVPFPQQAMVPDKRRAGKTFKKFVEALQNLGYTVEWRELRACDYGAPTIRKRFFLIARCDGRPIVWPKPTHGDPKSEAVRRGKLKPWRTAAEIIDWSIPCPSIFDRKRPLAENTMRRIARGIKKFVLENPEPFIVQVNHAGEHFRGQSISDPMSTITAKHGYGLVTPTVIQYHTEQGNGEHRGQRIDEPILTVDASNRYGLVSAFLAKHYGGNYAGAGSDLDDPIHTITSQDHNALVTAHIARQFGQSIGHEADMPMGTITAGGGGKSQLVTSHILKLKGTNIGHVDTEPLQTITAGGFHFGEVRTFLIKYFGQGVGQEINEPLHTVTGKDRFGLVTIHGEDYAIVDIGMRMLEPRELYNAHNFPADYIIDRDSHGKPIPKSVQVSMVGNSVPPPFSEALVRANLPELCTKQRGGAYNKQVKFDMTGEG